LAGALILRLSLHTARPWCPYPYLLPGWGVALAITTFVTIETGNGAGCGAVMVDVCGIEN
jgi:hypothetical protein